MGTCTFRIISQDRNSRSKAEQVLGTAIVPTCTKIALSRLTSGSKGGQSQDNLFIFEMVLLMRITTQATYSSSGLDP